MILSYYKASLINHIPWAHPLITLGGAKRRRECVNLVYSCAKSTVSLIDFGPFSVAALAWLFRQNGLPLRVLPPSSTYQPFHTFKLPSTVMRFAG